MRGVYNKTVIGSNGCHRRLGVLAWSEVTRVVVLDQGHCNGPFGRPDLRSHIILEMEDPPRRGANVQRVWCTLFTPYKVKGRIRKVAIEDTNKVAIGEESREDARTEYSERSAIEGANGEDLKRKEERSRVPALHHRAA